MLNFLFLPFSERTIARHELAEVEHRHKEDIIGDLSSLTEKDDMVIIYNRVPKTASTSFTNIAYDLCGKNRFHVLHINTTKNNPVLSLQDQVRQQIVRTRKHSNTNKFIGLLRNSIQKTKVQVLFQHFTINCKYFTLHTVVFFQVSARQKLGSTKHFKMETRLRPNTRLDTTEKQR